MNNVPAGGVTTGLVSEMEESEDDLDSGCVFMRFVVVVATKSRDRIRLDIADLPA